MAKRKPRAISIAETVKQILLLQYKANDPAISQGSRLSAQGALAKRARAASLRKALNEWAAAKLRDNPKLNASKLALILASEWDEWRESIPPDKRAAIGNEPPSNLRKLFADIVKLSKA